MYHYHGINDSYTRLWSYRPLVLLNNRFAMHTNRIFYIGWIIPLKYTAYVAYIVYIGTKNKSWMYLQEYLGIILATKAERAAKYLMETRIWGGMER